jgi:uncharacterized protein YjbJ (UPF0337 family)
VNRNEIEGNWKQLKGEAKTRWGELTDDELTATEGAREKLIGKLQERYGKSQAQAAEEVDDFFDSLDRAATS